MSTGSIKTSNHYAALDALRGLAAISVLLFHFHEWLGLKWLAPNARFAVDFFFCLSGYVLSSAYDKKIINGLSKTTLFLTRATRLMPIIVLGTGISFLYFFIRTLKLDYPLDYNLLLFAAFCGIFNIPFLGAPKIIGGPQVFPLNGPQYTLFLEFAVNIFWIITHRYLSIHVIIAIIIVSFSLLCLFGVGGDTTNTFWLGLPRVTGAFYLGVLAYRFEHKLIDIREKYSRPIFIIASISTALLFYWPSDLPDLAGVVWGFVVSPLLVISGSRFSLSERFRRIGLLLGQLSYPIYALQFPIFLWVNGTYQQLVGQRDPFALMVIVTFAVLLSSWLALRFYDEPVRAYLNRMLKKDRSRYADAKRRLL